MKRITTIIILLVTLIPAHSKGALYSSINFEYSYDTNIFSSPLPQYDDNGYWLKWRSENPFNKIHNLGANLELSYFFTKTARTGISSSFEIKFPYRGNQIKPVPDIPYTPDIPNSGYTGNWEYVETKLNNFNSISVFGSFGPSFRAYLGNTNIGLSTRLSIGTFDLNKQELIMGLQIVPYFNYIFNDKYYINVHFNYNAHLICFIKDPNKIYKDHYQMLSVSPSIGFGIKF